MTEILDENLSLNEDTLKGKFLTFSIGNVIYAIEIRYVTEIIGLQPVTEVPQLPVFVKGVINLRGKIIPVMDVRLRFNKSPAEYNNRTCIVVIEVNGNSTGLIVDHVSDVLSIAEEDIVPPPEMNKGLENKFIKAIAKVDSEVKLILDCDKIIDIEVIENISGIEIADEGNQL